MEVGTGQNVETSLLMWALNRSRSGTLVTVILWDVFPYMVVDADVLRKAVRVLLDCVVPVDMKIRGGSGKYLLKKLAERYLPKEINYRRKMGFAIPVVHWLRGRIAPLIEEVLFDAMLMESLNSVVIRKTVKEFREQNIDHSSRLWVLLM